MEHPRTWAKSLLDTASSQSSKWEKQTDENYHCWSEKNRSRQHES